MTKLFTQLNIHFSIVWSTVSYRPNFLAVVPIIAEIVKKQIDIMMTFSFYEYKTNREI